MNKDKIWLSSPHMGGNEQEFVQQAFDSNWVTTLGPNVDGFEQDLENYLGNNSFVAALNSGTSAIHLGLILLEVQAGDEVICQSFTFSASANPILYQGATPIFVDSEPETWNICPTAMEKAIRDRIENGRKPKAIIIVHLYGMPCKMDEIQKIANTYQIPILEDSAEALGSTYKGQKCGTFGTIAVFSFNGNKIITTSGGGALICKSKDQKDKTIFLATQARDNAPHYQHSKLGFNYRMSNVCAGIGRGQMLVLDNHIQKRRDNYKYYLDNLAEISDISFLSEPYESFSNRWLSCIIINPDNKKRISKETLRQALEKENIESRPLWKPLHLQPIFRNYTYYGTNVSEKLFENGLCLPSSSNLTFHDLERVVTAIKNIFLED